MSDFSKELCYVMHKFVSEHIDDIKVPITSLSDGYWKSYDAMLKSIKRNANDAGWALCELCTWGFDSDYAESCFVADRYETKEGFDEEIFKITDRSGKNRYFKVDAQNNWTPIEVKKVLKLVEIWEE